MLKKLFKNIFNLQYFAEGAAAGGEGGDGSPAEAQQQDSLEALGVPRDKVEKYRAKKGYVKNADTAQQAAFAETEPEADDEAAWEAAKKNPAINKRIQDTVSKRLSDYARKNGDAQGKLDKLAPVLELVGRKAGIDTSDIANLDIDEFVNAVNSDPSYFEDLAEEMGVDIDTARRIDTRERDAQRAERAANEQAKETALREHYDNLVRQGDAIKKMYPGFDLQRELDDPWFARVTAPGGGLSVKQAFDAKYHDQILAAARENTARFTTQAVSNSIMAGRRMPSENGTNNRAAVQTTAKPYSQMTSAERDEFFKRLTGENRRRR